MKKFHDFSLKDKLKWLADKASLSASELINLKKSLSYQLSDKFIENSIGQFSLPLGVIPEIIINDKTYTVPMSVEETSIIAAASKTASFIQKNKGSISFESLGNLSIGQIQIPVMRNTRYFEEWLSDNQSNLITKCNDFLPSLFARGGGVREIKLRTMTRPDGKEMGVIHVMVDTQEAMGANMINQLCEFIKPIITNEANETCGMAILSNLNDSKLTRVKIKIPMNQELGEKVAEASLFAQLDPYRAATNNKGIFNAMDAVTLATGNDWRAVSAGAWGYLNVTKKNSLSTWTYQDGFLLGEMTSPVIVGTVGGVTTLHPQAKVVMKILNNPTSSELSGIIASVGLVQNLGALIALTTQGIVAGHMRLHIKNLVVSVTTNKKLQVKLEQKLVELLEKEKKISHSDAVRELEKLNLKS